MQRFGQQLTAVALLALVGALGGTARAAPKETRELGAAAPRNGWTMEGGCAARNGVSRTPPLRGPLEEAWTLEAKGPIEGEPLVYGSWVAVCAREAPDKRALLLLDLDTGKVRSRKQFKTSEPLEPILDRGVLLLRTRHDKLEAFRLFPGGPVRFWSLQLESSVHSVLMLDRAAYVRTTRGIECYPVGKRKPSWTRTGTFRGRLAARGDSLFVVQYDASGNASLAQLLLSTGTSRAAVQIGHHRGKTPEVDARLPISALDKSVMVQHALPIPLAGGGAAQTTEVERTRLSGGTLLGKDNLLDVIGEPLAWGDGWIGVLKSRKQGRLLVHMTADGRFGTLGSKETLPQIVNRPSYATRAREVGFLGDLMVDLSTDGVLAKLPFVPEGRVVPARTTVLARRGEAQLVAFRESGRTRTGPQILVAPEAAPAASFAGRLVARSGDVVSGSLTLDLAAGTVSLAGGKKPRTWPLDDVLLVEDDKARLLVAAAGDEILVGLEELAASERAMAYAQLARAAGAANAIDLLERLTNEAWQRGAPEKELKWAEARLKVLRKRKNLKAQSKKVEQVLAREQALAGLEADLLWQRVSALPDSAPATVRFDMLRELLARAPDHAEAGKQVRSMLPKGMEPTNGAFHAREWLDLVETSRIITIGLIPTPDPKNPDLTHGERTFGVQLHTWRKDLVAVRSPQLMIVTPLARPGSVARCISMGELVCSTLESFFAGGTNARETRYPLTLLLYETEEEYRKIDAGTGEAVSQWSAGHYSPRDELSRLYLPDDDAEFRRVMAVFAHELTHQWLRERCPSFGTADALKANPTTPAYWLVEGFAELVESFRFDLRNRTFQVDPRAEYLDLVARIDPKKLIPWDQLLTLDHFGFMGLSRESDISVPITRKLGWHRKISTSHVFYAQAATVSLYLFHAEGGKHRQALLEFVGARYSGAPPPVDVAFGMSAQELGAKALAFARKAAQGR